MAQSNKNLASKNGKAYPQESQQVEQPATKIPTDEAGQALEQEVQQAKNQKPNETKPEPTEQERPKGQKGGKISGIKQNLQESKRRADPTKIFGPLLFDGEVGILFGSEKSGKSALAIQLANHYAAGTSMDGFENETKEGKRVLFMDLELSDKQQEIRYTNLESDEDEPGRGLNLFSDNLDRYELDPAQIDDNYTETLFEDIEANSQEYDLIIIDNLSWLVTGDQERSSDARNLSHRVHAISRLYNITFLLLSHTTKNISKNNYPLTTADLAGSYQFSAVADSIFALGKNAQDPEIRYVKQLATRSAPEKMGAEEVKTLRFDKSKDFLGFLWLRDEPEANHLQTRESETEQQIEQDIRTQLNKGKSVRETSQALGVGHRRVARISKELRNEKG